MNVSAGQEQIVKTVINGLLPVGGDAACIEQIFQTISGLIEGRSNPATVRAAIANALQTSGRPMDSERIQLCVETAFGLACGYGYWMAAQKPIILRAFPAWELVKSHPGPEPLNWPDTWQLHGGWSLPSGRMIAFKDDPVWRALSTFELPFPPFDLGSGMYWREVSHDEAIELGLIDEDEPRGEHKFGTNDGVMFGEDALDPDLLRQIKAELAAEGFLENHSVIANGRGADLSSPAGIEAKPKTRQFEKPPPRRSVNVAPVSLDFAEAFARRVAHYFGPQGRSHRTDTTPSQASASELLALAQHRMLAARGGTSTIAPEIISLLERALDLGFGEGTHEQMRACALLVDAFDLIKEPEEAAAHCAKHLEFLRAWLQKGIPIDSNQRSIACGLVARVYEQLRQPDQATVYRQLELENRDGFTLLNDARERLKSASKRIDEETGAEILDLLNKAAERIPQNYPECHADIYHATGEILEAWGDSAQAIEYYEYASQKKREVSLKRRGESVRKTLPKQDTN